MPNDPYANRAPWANDPAAMGEQTQKNDWSTAPHPPRTYRTPLSNFCDAAKLDVPEDFKYAKDLEYIYPPEELAQLKEHFRTRVVSEWGCPPDWFDHLWALTPQAREPQNIFLSQGYPFEFMQFDPSLEFNFNSPTPDRLTSYSEEVRTNYNRMIDHYKRVQAQTGPDHYGDRGCYIAFTAPASGWWPWKDEKLICANTLEGLLKLCFLAVGVQNPESRVKIQKGKKGGRSEEYTSWLEACAEYRAEVAKLRAVYTAAVAERDRAIESLQRALQAAREDKRVTEAREALRALEAQGAPRRGGGAC